MAFIKREHDSTTYETTGRSETNEEETEGISTLFEGMTIRKTDSNNNKKRKGYRDQRYHEKPVKILVPSTVTMSSIESKYSKNTYERNKRRYKEKKRQKIKNRLELKNISYEKLRKICKMKGIKNYDQLSKKEMLLECLKDKEEERRQNRLHNFSVQHINKLCETGRIKKYSKRDRKKLIGSLLFILRKIM